MSQSCPCLDRSQTWDTRVPWVVWGPYLSPCRVRWGQVGREQDSMLWEAMGHRHTGTHWAPAVCHVLSVPHTAGPGP